jgi:hypothetical protein
LNWEVMRHEWGQISPKLEGFPGLIQRFLECRDRKEATWLYWQMDFMLVPNQVLQPGSPESASCIIQLLPEFSDETREWARELLVQFSAGTIGPTAADPDVVKRMAAELPFAIPQAAQILQYGNRTEALLCVDLPTICCEHAPGQRRRIEFLFSEFAKRGPEDERAIRVTPAPPFRDE